MKEKQLAKIQHTPKGQRILFERYYAPMLVVAIRYLKINEDAEDALSEAFVRIFKNQQNFNYQGEGSLRKWIKTIVINESIRLLNKRKKMEFNDILEEVDMEFTHDLGGGIDMEYFLSVVNTLPDGYRIVFLMYVVEEFTHKEIAEKLNISISTSKSQLFKARGLIVKKLSNCEQHETIRFRKTV